MWCKQDINRGWIARLLGTLWDALRRLKFMLLEVYNCIKKVNAPCLHNLFNTNTIPYQLRTSKLEQPLRRTTRYGLRTFSYVGSHLWNSILKWSYWYCSYWFQWIQDILKYMERPGYFSNMRYPSSGDFSAVSGLSFGVCRVLHISIDIFIASLYVFFYLMIVYSVFALYIFAPYSRILAFG